jgi:hypothetical protein
MDSLIDKSATVRNHILAMARMTPIILANLDTSYSAVLLVEQLRASNFRFIE